MSEFNGDELLAMIDPQLPEDSVQVCLRRDLLEARDKAENDLISAKAAVLDGRRMNPVGGHNTAEIQELAEEVQRLEQEIDEKSPWFRFRAIDSDKFEALAAEHPPREDNRLDLMRGYDYESLSKALVRKCLIDPVFSDEGWAKLRAACPIGEWSALRDAVMELNGQKVIVPPKSLLASQVLTSRGSDSE